MEMTEQSSRLYNGNNSHIKDLPSTPRTGKTIPDDNMNETLIPRNHPLDETLTPGNPKYSSPLPNALPPPPQFGNEVLRSSTPHHPPPYREALNRSNLVSSFDSNLHFHSSNSSNNTTTISYDPAASSNAHDVRPTGKTAISTHQPIIFQDDQNPVGESDSDRTTPSPTTHIILPTEEEDSESAHFYEQQVQTSGKRPEQVKVTFV